MISNSSEAQIRKLVEDWAKAVRAKDMERALANHTNDIVMFDVPMPIQSKGMKQYEKTWQLFFDNSSGGPGSFDLTELQITASDTVAFAHALLQIDGSTGPVGRLSMGLREEDGEWRIAHEHHSYPVASEQDQQ